MDLIIFGSLVAILAAALFFFVRYKGEWFRLSDDNVPPLSHTNQRNRDLQNKAINHASDIGNHQ